MYISHAFSIIRDAFIYAPLPNVYYILKWSVDVTVRFFASLLQLTRDVYMNFYNNLYI